MNRDQTVENVWLNESSAALQINVNSEPVIRNVYGALSADRVAKYHGTYSLVATPEHELGILQTMPHCDTALPYFFAVLLYLNPGNYGGTNFYRHNPTGFERVTAERFPYYMDAAKEYLNQHGMPSREYYKATDGHFSVIGSVEYKPNRLIVYPGNLLHSGSINPLRDIDASPQPGRLTANIFVDYT